MQEAKFNAEEIQKCVHIATALTLRQKMEELSNSMGEDEEETPDIIKKKKKLKLKHFLEVGINYQAHLKNHYVHQVLFQYYPQQIYLLQNK